MLKKIAFIKTHEKLSACLIFVGFLFIFLFKGIFTAGYFAPADVLRGIQPFASGVMPHNALIGDIAWQFLPWLKLAKELISQGHFPLWNVYSGGGLPLFANSQSAVFFPLTWLFYVLNLKAALILYSFIKLLLIGFFTYLFLRELKLSYLTSVIGGTAFMFAGVNVVWLLWPLSSVIIFLPLALFLIERYFHTEEIKYLLLLSSAIALAVFAGHPQTFFYVFMLIVGYFCFKLLMARMRVKIPIGRYFYYGLFFVIGILLSGVVIVPFLEYLKLSQNLVSRQQFLTNPFYLHKALFITNFIPDFFGNPAFRGFSYLAVPNYSEITMGYVGITLLLLALYGLFVSYKNATVKFFTAVSLVCFILIYHVNPIYDWINKLPGFSVNYNNRLLYLWAFGMVILGCYGVEALSKKLDKKKLLISSAIFFVIFAALFAVNKYQTRFYPTQIKWHSINLWQNLLLMLFLVNLICTVLVLTNLQRKYAKVVLLLLVFVETGIHGIIFNTVTKKADFFPTSGVTTFLQTQFQNGYNKVFPYGHILLPNLGTWYGFDQLTDYDALDLKSSEQLKAKVADFNQQPEYTFQNPNLNALRFLGVKYLVYPSDLGQQFAAQHQPDLNVVYQDTNNVILQLRGSLPRAYTIQTDNFTDLQQKLNDLMQGNSTAAIKSVDDYRLYQNGESTLSYNSPTDTYLILNENYYPDWIATLDNYKPITVENALGLKIVPLPKGQHILRVSYEPKSVVLGADLSMFGLLLLVLFTVRPKPFFEHPKKILQGQ